MRTIGEFEAAFNRAFPGAGLLYWKDRAWNFIFVPREKLRDAVGFARDSMGFDILMDHFAVDYLDYPVPLPEGNRFEIVTYLYSVAHNDRIFIKSYYPAEKPQADSLVTLFAGANWFEREMYDMFGIDFKGHPDLRRILMYEGFAGHPLRRDYDIKKRQPLVGPLN